VVVHAIAARAGAVARAAEAMLTVAATATAAAVTATAAAVRPGQFRKRLGLQGFRQAGVTAVPRASAETPPSPR
jgi:hypothetical protein